MRMDDTDEAADAEERERANCPGCCVCLFDLRGEMVLFDDETDRIYFNWDCREVLR